MGTMEYGYNMNMYHDVNTQCIEKEKKEKNEVRTKRRYRKKERDENGNIIKKRKKSGLTRLCYMSQELKDIVGFDGPLARNCITKKFWDYTEKNGLKKPGRIIMTDEKLKSVWGQNVEQIHMYSVQKGLKEHITTMSKEEEEKYKQQNPHLFQEELKELQQEQERKKKNAKTTKKKKKNKENDSKNVAKYDDS